MAIFEYRCDDHGTFEVNRPMGAAEPRTACIACGAKAARVFSPPRLARTSQAVSVARDLEEKSRDSPDVVTSLPARPRRPARPADPRLRRLPRP